MLKNLRKNDSIYDVLADPRILRITSSVFDLFGIENKTFVVISKDEVWLDELEIPGTNIINLIDENFKGSVPSTVDEEFYKTFYILENAQDDLRLIVSMMKVTE